MKLTKNELEYLSAWAREEWEPACYRLPAHRLQLEHGIAGAALIVFIKAWTKSERKKDQKILHVGANSEPPWPWPTRKALENRLEEANGRPVNVLDDPTPIGGCVNATGFWLIHETALRPGGLPMENHRTFAIVVGYHECSYPPPKAYDAGLTERFAVVFNTYRPDKADAFFDADLYIRIFEAICQAIPHDSLTIEMGAGQDLHSLHDLSEWYLTRRDDDRDAPERVWLSKEGRLAAHAETEFWVFAGGPSPYHDSYTLSFYTPEDRAEDFRGICERVAEKMGATITGIHKALASKEPFTPVWKVALKWLRDKMW